MSRIRGKNTKPEILVRKGLHARGFRFRLHDRTLPGSPDVVLPKWGVAILVNGCFWHGHKGCRYATRPKSNVEFWEAKNARNRHRDEVTEARLDALCDEIRLAAEHGHEDMARRQVGKALTKREREEMLQRQARLEAEIRALYPIPKRIRRASEEYEG